jgi:hypothetical protein
MSDDLIKRALELANELDTTANGLDGNKKQYVDDLIGLLIEAGETIEALVARLQAAEKVARWTDRWGIAPWEIIGDWRAIKDGGEG